MKTWYFPYTLKLKGNSAERKGALFRFEFENSEVCYGDLLPWPEFGDQSLEEELANIKDKRFSPLFSQAIALAKQSKFLNIRKSSIENHFIINDISNVQLKDLKTISSQGSSSIKVKVGRNLDSEIQWINEMASAPMTFRLDFNARLNFKKFESFFKKLNFEVQKKIEFIEDPMPFHFEDWSRASMLVPLAIDFEYENWERLSHFEKAPFEIIVLKPSRQNYQAIIEKTFALEKKYVVTSSMDPILGEKLVQNLLPDLKKKLGKRMLSCGCQTQHLFEDHLLFHCKNFEELSWVAI